MLYESLTFWRAGAWLVRVHAHLTSSKSSAETFGRIPMRLRRYSDRLALVDQKLGQEIDQAYDDNIAVFKLRQGADLLLPIDLEMYSAVDLCIADFAQHPELEQLVCVEHGIHEFTIAHLPAWMADASEIPAHTQQDHQ